MGKPFTFFDSKLPNILNEQKGVECFYFTGPVTKHKLFTKRWGLTEYGIHLARWFIENADGEEYVFITTKGDKKSVGFKKIALANKFEGWMVGFTKKWETDLFDDDLWKTKHDWIQQTEETGEMSIKGKVDYDVNRYVKQDILDEETFILWCWFQDHIKHDVWYWDKTFYFESGKEATFFKLTWAGDLGGDNDD